MTVLRLRLDLVRLWKRQGLSDPQIAAIVDVDHDLRAGKYPAARQTTMVTSLWEELMTLRKPDLVWLDSCPEGMVICLSMGLLSSLRPNATDPTKGKTTLVKPILDAIEQQGVFDLKKLLTYSAILLRVDTQEPVSVRGYIDELFVSQSDKR